MNMSNLDIVAETKCKEEKLGKCEVCDLRTAKYTCPRCEVKTCSLPCVSIHKRELECTGIRDKTFFKKVSKMGNLDLLSDYRLLEEISRSVEKSRNDPLKHSSDWPKRPLPIGLHKILGATRLRGMRYHYLPSHFTRHKENTTYLNYKARRLEWRVEWIFPQAGNLCLISERVLETMTLAQALSPHLDPSLCEDDVLRDRLQYYFSAGVQHVCYLMRVGERQKNRYHLLDGTLSLYANLQKKSIIEFPTIYIVLKDHKYCYSINDSDCDSSTDEEDTDTKGKSCEEISDGKTDEETDDDSDTPCIVNDKPSKNLLVTNEDSFSSSSDN